MAIYMWRDVQIPDCLCFTANTAGSTVILTKSGSPTTVTLETSTDGITRTTYTFGSTITLSNIGDKVYWRNTSETTTGFSTASGKYYKFVLSGSINASGDITSLINKGCTDTLSGSYCFYQLFDGCASLITPPELPAINLVPRCYQSMFYGCTGLTSSPELPATTLKTYCYCDMFNGCSNLETITKLGALTLPDNCYNSMFANCSKIKISDTQTGIYQTAYRIPTIGTGTQGNYSLTNIFVNTGGTFSGGTLPINRTYYTSNQVI